MPLGMGMWALGIRLTAEEHTGVVESRINVPLCQALLRAVIQGGVKEPTDNGFQEGKNVQGGDSE